MECTEDPPRMFQVALSSSDVERSQRWYCDGLGMVPSGLRAPDAAIDRLRESGALPSDFTLVKLQLLPEPVVIDRQAWAVDQQDFFQIEIFQYVSPKPKPHGQDHTPADLGYSLFGVHVVDFDGTLLRLAALGSTPISAVLGVPGSRRACVRDPDGVFVELMEDDPRTPTPIRREHPRASAAVRYVRVSVPDLDAGRRFFGDALDLPETSPETLHSHEHEQLWCLGDADRDLSVLIAGDTWIELAEYRLHPTKPGRKRRLLSDHGILNIAVGNRTRAGYRRVRDSVRADGFTAGVEAELEFSACLYVFDRDGLSVELAFVGTESEQAKGLVPTT
jgi:catechol 2,3-dioxygenase-like lactoylglutathione lyase family enzyme